MSHVLCIIFVTAEHALHLAKTKTTKKSYQRLKEEVNEKMQSAMQVGSTLAFVLAPPRLSEHCISFLLPHRGRRQALVCSGARWASDGSPARFDAITCHLTLIWNRIQSPSFGDEKAAAPFARRSSSFPSDFFLRKKKNIFHLTGRRDSQKRQVLGAEEFWRRSELRFGPGSQISGGQRQTNRDSQTEASG